MHKRALSLFLLSAAFGLLTPCPAPAQSIGNQQKFVLVRAFALPATPRTISVFFGDKFPLDPNAPQNTLTLYTAAAGSPFAPSKWIVRAVDLTTHQLVESQSQIDSVQVLTFGRQVELNMANQVDTTRFSYIIIYAEANTPLVTLGRAEKKGAERTFTAAKGKNDADIYFSGEAAAARNSKPAYSIESKFSYLYNLTRGIQTGDPTRPISFRDYGSIGVAATFNSAANSEIDPDSITVGGLYQRSFLFGPSPTSILLNSEFIKAELDKKNQTRNLVTGVDATLVLPSKRLNQSTKHPAFATMDFLLGVEGGRNYKNELQEDGLGNFWRLKLGAASYFYVLKPWILDRINFNTEYKLRLPQSAEIFTQTIDGEKQTFFTKRPRHYAASDLDFMFAPSYGLALKYRYGTLPPAFKLVDSKVSVGFVLQFQQTNK
jgi:hypothetical protein